MFENVSLLVDISFPLYFPIVYEVKSTEVYLKENLNILGP